MGEIKITVAPKKQMSADMSTPKYEVDFNSKVKVILPSGSEQQPYEHDKLDHLDYDSSGHTGFASAKLVEDLAKAQALEIISAKNDAIQTAKSYTDTQLEAYMKISTFIDTYKGKAGGVAELDSSGRVPSSQLPSYVDDVLEYASFSVFPTTGESGKIYVDLFTNKTYRWGGTAYAEIPASLALGETSSTAYAGDKGKANEVAINEIKGTLEKIQNGTTSVAKAEDADKLGGKDASEYIESIADLQEKLNNVQTYAPFIGTMDEYKAAYSLGKISVGMLVLIEDGDSSDGNNSTSAVLGKAILGQMILG